MHFKPYITATILSTTFLCGVPLLLKLGGNVRSALLALTDTGVSYLAPTEFDISTLSLSASTPIDGRTTTTYNPEPISWGIDLEDCVLDLRSFRTMQEIVFRCVELVVSFTLTDTPAA